MSNQHHEAWLELHHEVKPLAREALELVAQGMSDGDIALQIDISERIVKWRINQFVEREEIVITSPRTLPAWCGKHLMCCILQDPGQVA